MPTLAKCVAAAAGLGLGLSTMRAGHPGTLRVFCSLAILYLAAWGLVVSLAGSRAGRRAWAARFLACTAAVLLGVGMFELPALLGIIDYRIPFASPTLPWQRPGNRPDPDLLSIKEGHRRVRESFTGNETPWVRGAGAPRVYRSDRRYDRDGFRNPRDIDRADAIILGDSFIEGAHVSEDELISARLATEPGPGREVVNLGQAGYGPIQELHVLRRFGVPRRPGVCVWAFYEGNDLDDIGDYQRRRALIAECERSGRGLGPGFAERCFSANALGFVLRAWIDPPPRRPASQFRAWFADDRGRQIPILFASGDYRREPVPPDPSADAAGPLGRLREIFREANSLCRDRGIRLVVVFIPTKLRVYRGACTFEEGSVCADWTPDALPDAIGSMVAGISPDLAYLDLTPRFQAEANRGALLYLADDTHWSAEGHRSAALAIADLIR